MKEVIRSLVIGGALFYGATALGSDYVERHYGDDPVESRPYKSLRSEEVGFEKQFEILSKRTEVGGDDSRFDKGLGGKDRKTEKLGFRRR